MKEIPLMREFQYEAARAIPRVRLFRRNIAKIQIEDRMIVAGIKGQCDLYGLVRGGMHLEIELKSKNGVLTDKQQVWRDWCRSWDIPWMAMWAYQDETPARTVDRWIQSLWEMLHRC